ncbi:M48 family metallopeptidase [Candidatus Woesearchaeota archaeon]|nr:M48 family metallopeptidase [Candidatus Woesearchaeota archaeon]
MNNQITSNKIKSVLLFLIFFVIITILGYIFGLVFNFGYSGVVFGFIFSLLSALFSYYYGDKLVLRISGAREVTKNEYLSLFETIEKLRKEAKLPMPKIHVMPGNQINAFATGRNPQNASISVTEGALMKLNKEELEGVLAHEISHIKNFDIRLMVLTAVMVGTIVMLSHFFIRSFLFSGNRDRNNSSGQLIVLAIGFVLAILSPIFAQLIKLAISRRREYLADSSGVLLSKNPIGLANALKKISQDKDELKTANGAIAHLFISNPFKGKKNLLFSLFSTHPSLESRISKLEELRI